MSFRLYSSSAGAGVEWILLQLPSEWMNKCMRIGVLLCEPLLSPSSFICCITLSNIHPLVLRSWTPLFYPNARQRASFILCLGFWWDKFDSLRWSTGLPFQHGVFCSFFPTLNKNVRPDEGKDRTSWHSIKESHPAVLLSILHLTI